MKWIKYVEYILLAFCILSVAAMFVMPKVMFQGAPTVDIEVMLIWMYVIIIMGVITMLISPVLNIIKYPKALFKALIGLVAAVILVGGCYLLSSNAPVVNSAGGFFDDSFQLKLTDTMLYLMYIGLGAGVLTILYTEIRNAFK